MTWRSKKKNVVTGEIISRIKIQIHCWRIVWTTLEVWMNIKLDDIRVNLMKLFCINKSSTNIAHKKKYIELIGYFIKENWTKDLCVCIIWTTISLSSTKGTEQFKLSRPYIQAGNERQQFHNRRERSSSKYFKWGVID